MKPSLKMEGLTKRFGELKAVDSLDLEVRSGEVFGLLGPNGAGKTTTISMVCGLLAADSGRVLLDGREIAGDRLARRSMGYCPQRLVIWDRLTCREQLEFSGRLYGMGRAEVRASAGRLLSDLGLEEKAGKQARTLSGGMQRRLNIALALVHDPSLVVFDEPEAGLDPQSRVLVRDYIRSLADRKTVIVTTHDMDEAERMSDRVAIMDQGKLLVLDSPAALKARFGAEGRPAPDLEYVFLGLTGKRLRD
jgi:ABC-2 type transport system ATP-binding protein